MYFDILPRNDKYIILIINIEEFLRFMWEGETCSQCEGSTLPNDLSRKLPVVLRKESKLAIMCDMLLLIRLFKESSLSNNLRVMTFRLLLFLQRVALW